MAAFGLDEEIAGAEIKSEQEEQADVDEFEVFEENWATVQAFRAIETQWHWASINLPLAGGLGGFSTRLVRTALKHEAIPILFSMRGIKKKDRSEIYEGILVMERAALQEMRKQEAQQSD
ncbi:DUF1799 domain-containing protein [Herbaspirillum sp. ST 5-3]|uniref:DUF1799 domain-containing protein n=1 Tax=Oxalobacteraceae TaxID=75682 RepID=UPI0010A36856|nr:DUF1799 domain-containing protein [Herbaspirillum sp. ST 5-3]